MRKKTKRTAQRKAVASSAVLACGHPGRPNNLTRGKCGTCKAATDWEKLSNETSDPDLKILTHKIAKQFREGKMIYDRNGKTLLEWEKALRPQANDAPHELPHPGE